MTLLLFAFNMTTAGVFLCICAAIVRGLARTGQLGENALAWAAAGIFAASAAHRLLYALQLLVNPTSVQTASHESWVDWLILCTDATGAVIGVAYLIFRLRSARLFPTSGLFVDASDARYRQLASLLPNTVVLLYDTDERVLLADGALTDFGMTSDRLEGKQLRDVVGAFAVRQLSPSWQGTLRGEPADLDHYDPGTGQTMRLRMRPVMQRGAVAGGVIFSENVTEPS